ncbi:hypothetical protein SLE2022_048930 [Rubroshorea leprosula]
MSDEHFLIHPQDHFIYNIFAFASNKTPPFSLFLNGENCSTMFVSFHETSMPLNHSIGAFWQLHIVYRVGLGRVVLVFLRQIESAQQGWNSGLLWDACWLKLCSHVDFHCLIIVAFNKCI